MKLFIGKGTCSLAAQIILNEVNVHAEILHVNVKTKTYHGKDYLRVNRNGYVPALETDDGNIICETVAINHYLANLKMELGLIPVANTPEFQKMLELELFIATEIHQKFLPVFRDYVEEIAKNRYRELLVRNIGWLDAKLSDKHPYLTGANLTVADAYLFSLLPWAELLAVDISELHQIHAFQQRVLARSAVQKALQDEAKFSSI